MSQEPHLNWLKLLPLALFRPQAVPKWPFSILPFILMYGLLVLIPGLLSEPLPFPDHLLPHCCITSIPSYGNLLTALYLNHVLTPAHLQSTWRSAPDQQLWPLSPKWQGLFKIIIVTPTAAKLDGLPHLSYLKPFTPPPQDNLFSFTGAQTCSLKFQRTPRSTAPSPVPGWSLTPQPYSTLLDWDPYMFSFLIPTSTLSYLLYQFPHVFNDILKFPINYSAIVRDTTISHRARGTKTIRYTQVIRNSNTPKTFTSQTQKGDSKNKF